VAGGKLGSRAVGTKYDDTDGVYEFCVLKQWPEVGVFS
jgi:hypothetical protein